MPGFDRFDGFASVVLAWAAISAAVWGLFLAYRWARAFPTLPGAGPVTGELRPESPAVANLLVHRWSPNNAAVQATILDLAARGYLGVELYAGGNIVLRVRRAPGRGEVTDYEDRVFRFVQSRAVNGSAPLDAVRLDAGKAADSWLASFRKGVVADAKRLGLARNRWSRDEVVQLAGTLLVPCVLFGLAFAVARIGEEVDSTTGERSGRWDPVWFSLVGWAAGCFALVKAGDFLRDTPAGRAACAHWLGVRKYLEDAAAFEDAGPAAVTVLGRNLAYAAAMGVAHDAVEDLPVLPEDPEVAWTRASGHWRSIRVDYPERFGFGQPPWKVFLDGLWRTGLLILVLTFGYQVITAVIDGFYDTFKSFDELNGNETEGLGDLRWLVLFLFGILAVAVIFWGSKAVDGVLKLVRGFLDVGRSRVLEGEIVKMYGGRIAVDNGVDDETIAWFPPLGAPALIRGDRVRVHHSPRLWHVSKVERLTVR